MNNSNLTTCIECGHFPVSKSAKACPNCGEDPSAMTCVICDKDSKKKGGEVYTQEVKTGRTENVDYYPKHERRINTWGEAKNIIFSSRSIKKKEIETKYETNEGEYSSSVWQTYRHIIYYHQDCVHRIDDMQGACRTCKSPISFKLENYLKKDEAQSCHRCGEPISYEICQHCALPILNECVVYFDELPMHAACAEYERPHYEEKKRQEELAKHKEEEARQQAEKESQRQAEEEARQQDEQQRIQLKEELKLREEERRKKRLSAWLWISANIIFLLLLGILTQVIGSFTFMSFLAYVVKQIFPLILAGTVLGVSGHTKDSFSAGIVLGSIINFAISYSEANGNALIYFIICLIIPGLPFGFLTISTASTATEMKSVYSLKFIFLSQLIYSFLSLIIGFLFARIVF